MAALNTLEEHSSRLVGRTHLDLNKVGLGTWARVVFVLTRNRRDLASFRGGLPFDYQSGRNCCAARCRAGRRRRLLRWIFLSVHGLAIVRHKGMLDGEDRLAEGVSGDLWARPGEGVDVAARAAHERIALHMRHHE
ncbi:RNA polymerase III C11 subunit, putative [Leishmania tarentolae]|uniref:RNA polymerase III C11 subunit, putative n=1 Tax=Leishmania tarentolae TaxID=5689 RepID=A0A640KKE8_LEITA|nr:RNA polymerase III C11 subunit, putative [Leishmania tarentolae]